ncbi:MAG: type II toxin-antitoxin system HicB family antitoxin [Pseudonocardiaceae bacterium]
MIERAEDGTYGAWSPDLLGCVATAQNYDSCVALMREAIAGHLEIMREYGDPIPEPRAVGPSPSVQLDGVTTSRTGLPMPSVDQ